MKRRSQVTNNKEKQRPAKVLQRVDGESNKKNKPRSKWKSVITTVGIILFFIYGVLPCFVMIYPQIVNEVTFLARFRWPPFINLSNPEEFNLNWTRSFRLDSAEGVTLGVWHLLPKDLQVTNEYSDNEFINHLSSGKHSVILYFHGNSGTRAGWHRVRLYKLFTRLNFHVITFDYRGYADSTSYPTETGVCDDAYFMYRWLLSLNKDLSVHIWGHSMGSGVATKVSKRICDEGLPLSSVMLEAPFNHIAEAALHFPLARPFSIVPWFEAAALAGLKYNNISFHSDIYIADVIVPMLILHAEDDSIVPYALGRKLYDIGLKTKKKGSLYFISFEGRHSYGHKHLHYAPELPQIISDFVAGKLKSNI